LKIGFRLTTHSPHYEGLSVSLQLSEH